MDKVEKYRAVYTCPLCGQRIMTNIIEAKRKDIPEALGKFVRMQQFAGNPYIHTAPASICHYCKDGSGGLAYFSGFLKVKE